MAIFCENNYFVCQSYGKRHKKALGKAQKLGAEGMGLYSG